MVKALAWSWWTSSSCTMTAGEGTSLEKILCVERMSREGTLSLNKAVEFGGRENLKGIPKASQDCLSLRRLGFGKHRPGFLCKKLMFSFQVWVRWKVPGFRGLLSRFSKCLLFA